MKKRRIYRLAAGVLTIFMALSAFSGCKPSEEEQRCSEGVAYLQALEAKSPEAVEEQLRQIEHQHVLAEREQRIRELIDNQNGVWKYFENYVILGDSRAVGFSYFGFLDESRVLAESGATILQVSEKLDELAELKPSTVYLCYGLNDIGIGKWDQPSDYVEGFAKMIESLRRTLPKAKIVVSSILPAREPAFQTQERWRRIPEFSAAIEEYCKENGLIYADNEVICEEHADLWEGDGIHVKSPFYPYWAANMIIASWGEDTTSE